jgi:hypothetical protein
VQRIGVVVLIVVAIGALVWALSRGPLSQAQNRGPNFRAGGSAVFTPAHKNLFDAAKEFIDWRTTPVQPIAFTHKVHLEKGLQCTDCHTSVEQGPRAGLPGVQLCMTCHQVIATDRPEIKKVAGYLARGEEIPWQRVYEFQPSAHVYFQHAPHIRAGVACGSCHGDLKQQTVAVRAVELNMGYCLNCHRQRKVSLDCTTCHY